MNLNSTIQFTHLVSCLAESSPHASEWLNTFLHPAGQMASLPFVTMTTRKGVCPVLFCSWKDVRSRCAGSLSVSHRLVNPPIFEQLATVICVLRVWGSSRWFMWDDIPAFSQVLPPRVLSMTHMLQIRFPVVLTPLLLSSHPWPWHE